MAGPSPARRKVFYNITITGLSVAVALVIGTIELGGLIAPELNLSGPSGIGSRTSTSTSSASSSLDVRRDLGDRLVVWRFGRIEERWSAALAEANPPDNAGAIRASGSGTGWRRADAAKRSASAASRHSVTMTPAR